MKRTFITKIVSILFLIIFAMTSLTAFADSSGSLSGCNIRYYEHYGIDEYDLDSLTLTGSGAIRDGAVSLGSGSNAIAYAIGLGEGITSIGKKNFSNMGTKYKPVIHFFIPNTVVSIGDYAFSNMCYDDEFYDTVTEIKSDDFVIPSSVQTIGQNAFLGFTSNNIYINKPKGSITGEPWGYTGTIHWQSVDISDSTESGISISTISNQIYTGNEIKPLPTIKCNDITLEKDTDYTLSYSNNINVGTGKITITGKGNYTGTISKTFNISARAISDTSISNISSQTYKGSSISPLPTITYNGKTLKKDTDYTLSYSDNINAGTGKITITGKGNFIGTTSKTFIIAKKSAEKLNISEIGNQIYTGKEIKPNIVITDTER